MTSIGVMLINYPHGGLSGDGLRGHHFAPLTRAVAGADCDPPALIALCEAKYWAAHGKRGLDGACAALEQATGRPYVGAIGWHSRGPHPAALGAYPPALLWDPQVFREESWGDETVPLHKRNVAVLSLRGRPGIRLRVVVQHWAYDDGDERLGEAKRIAWAAAADVETLFGGDCNTSASGPHLPQRDFTKVPPHKMRHKGWRPGGPGTPWMADTRAVDVLVGDYLRHEGTRVARGDGAGFHAICELAAAAGVPAAQAYRPTTNGLVPAGREDPGQLIGDWLLANAPLVAAVDPISYRVHVPVDGFDHCAVTATIDL